MRNAMTRWLIGLGLACASFAWFSTLYQATWGDANTWPDVVEAALDDGEARGEIVAEISARITDATGADQAAAAAELERVLADKAGRDALLEQVTAAADTASGIRVTLFEQLAGAASALPGLDAIAAADPALPDITGDTAPLPGTPAASSTRRIDLLERYGQLAAVGALALLGTGLVIGRWRVVARRFGWWAIVNGGVWIVAPFAVNAGARRWAPALDATIAVATATYTSRIIVSAGTLAAAGVACLILGHVVPSRSTGGHGNARQSRTRTAQAGAADTGNVHRSATAQRRTGPPGGPVEATAGTVQQHAGPVTHGRAADATGGGGTDDAVWWIAQPGAEHLEPGGVDVWAAYHQQCPQPDP